MFIGSGGMVPAPKTPVLAASTTPPHILAGGSGDNAAPTTLVEIVERLEDSFPPMQWNRSTCEGKGGDALLYGGMRRPPDVSPAPMLGVICHTSAPMTPPPAMPLEPAIPPAPAMPPPEDLVSPPPPPSYCFDAAVLDMGF